MQAVEWMVRLFTAYSVAGTLFAIVFVSVGVQRIDPQARGTGVAFRMMVLPGAAAFWPVLLVKWIRHGGAR